MTRVEELQNRHDETLVEYKKYQDKAAYLSNVAYKANLNADRAEKEDRSEDYINRFEEIAANANEKAYIANNNLMIVAVEYNEALQALNDFKRRVGA